ncbi:GtrA family protein [Streptococcus rupicaprae]|uniref:GtrA family protein n=1 Tax=Streptococcus rupicaprae TaxID=759619 RepID=UPI003F49FDCE
MLAYLIFGGLTTVVYFSTRILILQVSKESLLAAFLANVTAVLFAFVTNDRFVFRQRRTGWPQRLVKFALARVSTLLLDLFLTLIFTKMYPEFIGQYVNQDPQRIDAVVSLIGQILFVVLNYLLSKLFIFKDKHSPQISPDSNQNE